MAHLNTSKDLQAWGWESHEARLKLKQYLIVMALMVSLLAEAAPEALVGGSQERAVEPIVPGLLHAEHLLAVT